LCEEGSFNGVAGAAVCDMLLIDGCNGVETGGETRTERIVFQVTTVMAAFLAAKKWREYKALPEQKRAFENLEEVVIGHREDEARELLADVLVLRGAV